MARFRLKFFQTECSHKTHPPKELLGLQMIVVVYHKPENLKLWASAMGSEKWICGGPFLKIFKNCNEIFHT